MVHQERLDALVGGATREARGLMQRPGARLGLGGQAGRDQDAARRNDELWTWSRMTSA